LNGDYVFGGFGGLQECATLTKAGDRCGETVKLFVVGGSKFSPVQLTLFWAADHQVCLAEITSGTVAACWHRI